MDQARDFRPGCDRVGGGLSSLTSACAQAQAKTADQYTDDEAVSQGTNDAPMSQDQKTAAQARSDKARSMFEKARLLASFASTPSQATQEDIQQASEDIND